MKELHQRLARDAELSDPENRYIIRAYNDAEIVRLDAAVYSPLEKRYPSLKGVLEEIRTGYDPVARMQETKSQIQTLGALKELVDVISSVTENKDAQAAKRVFDKFDSVSELYDKFFPIQEQFYVDLAHAVKKVSVQGKIPVEDVVEDLPYMDIVSRIVHPTREGAESFLRTTQSFGKEMVDLGEGFIALAKKTGPVNEDLLKAAKLIPTVRAMKVIQKGAWDYRMHEFDRIYSS